MKRKDREAARAWIDAIVESLSPLGEISARSMFGGTAIYRSGRVFALAFQRRLYFKVDAESVGDFRSRGMGPFRPSERQTLKSYYEVPPDVLGDPEALRAWAAESILAASRSS